MEPGTSWDRTRLQVSTNGTSWVTAFESQGTSNVWVERIVDLNPYVGGDVYIRSWFHTINSLFNNYGGWNVDDVEVRANPSTPPPPNVAPTATITSPTSGSAFLTTDVISFNGSGDDAEDGALTGTSLLWPPALTDRSAPVFPSPPP